MKRIFLFLAIIVIGTCVFMLPSFADENIIVYINGVEVEFDNEKPIIEYERTLVPLRKVFEKLDCKVDYKNDEGVITIQKGITAVALQIGNPLMTVNDLVNGKSRNIPIYPKTDSDLPDVMPKIISDRTYIPVRAVAEALFCHVDYDDATKNTSITSDYKVTPCNNSNYLEVSRVTKYEKNTETHQLDKAETENFIYDRENMKVLDELGDKANITEIYDMLVSEENSYPVVFRVTTEKEKSKVYLIESPDKVPELCSDISYLFEENNEIVYVYYDFNSYTGELWVKCKAGSPKPLIDKNKLEDKPEEFKFNGCTITRKYEGDSFYYELDENLYLAQISDKKYVRSLKDEEKITDIRRNKDDPELLDIYINYQPVPSYTASLD